MNPLHFSRLVLSYRGSSRHSSQSSGFVMPLVILIGLTLTLAGFAMMQRASSQKNDATSKEAAAKAVSVAEAGVARITALLNTPPERRFLATVPSCVNPPLRQSGQNCADVSSGTAVVPNWQNLSETQIQNWTNAEACKLLDSTSIAAVQAISNSAGWQTLPQGKFRLVGYTYTDPNGNVLNAGNMNAPAGGVGVLTVEGIVNEGSASEATARVEVKIPIKPGPPETIGVPGLWVTETNNGDVVGNNTISGNVLVNDCNGELADVSFPPGTAYQAKYTNLDMPALPPPPATCNNLGNVNTSARLPRRNASNNYLDTPTTLTLNNGNTIQAYVYCVSSITLGGSEQLRVETLDTRPTINGANNPNRGNRFMVIFHLTGNIDIQGSADMVHTCPIPYETAGNTTSCTNYKVTDFNIYGRANPTGPANNLQYPKICLSGNSFVDAFVLGPNYLYGVAGGGGNGGVRGTVMVRQVSNSGGCGSNTSGIVITQTGTWDDMIAGIAPQATAPTLGAASGWSVKPTN